MMIKQNAESIQFVERIVSALLSDVDLQVDIFNLFQCIQKFNLTDREFIVLLQFISENIAYFKGNLKEPIELTNLMNYCGSALRVAEEEWGGSYNRNKITKEVKILLSDYGVI